MARTTLIPSSIKLIDGCENKVTKVASLLQIILHNQTHQGNRLLGSDGDELTMKAFFHIIACKEASNLPSTVQNHLERVESKDHTVFTLSCNSIQALNLTKQYKVPFLSLHTSFLKLSMLVCQPFVMPSPQIHSHRKAKYHYPPATTRRYRIFFMEVQ